MLRVARHDSCAVLTVDRPGARNALDLATLRALHVAVQHAGEEPTVRSVIITGAGGAFISGGDLKELQHKTSRADAEEIADLGTALCRAVETLPIPVIAVLAGPALGGGAELALACDFRIAETSATVGFIQAKMGVTVAWGSTARLVSLLGSSRAARALLLAEVLPADKAAALGLIDEVVSVGQGLSKAADFAAAIAACSRAAVGELKALLVRAREPVDQALRPFEREAFVATWIGEDHLQAVRAYFARPR